MKRKTGWYAVLATCMVSLFTGCSDQELVDSGALTDNQVVVLQGTAETKKVSRSALSDKGSFSWLKGDQIDVFASDDQFYPFTLTKGEGTSSGEFSAQLPAGEKVQTYAVSPANLAPTVSEGTLQLTLPSEYTWNEQQQTHAVMLARLDETNNLYFKNLGGLMKLSVSDIKEGCRIVVTSKDYQLSGTMAVTQDADGNDVLVAVKSSEDNKQITFVSTSTNGNQVFYLPLPVIAEKSKLKVEVYDAPENGVLKLTKIATLGVRRKELVIMPTLRIPEKVNAVVADAASTSALNDALKAAAESPSTPGVTEEPKEVIITVNSNTNLGEDEEASATVEVEAAIVIPQSITTTTSSGGDDNTGSEPGGDEGEGETGGGSGNEPGEGEGTQPEEKEVATVKITFDEVPVATAATENKIVLTDNQKVEEDKPNESQSQVVVAIPEVPTEEESGEKVEAPSFDISLPTTTVTLTATQETATFNEVWATTADSTLIVDPGVTINCLYVRSGNIKVGGYIEKIVSLTSKTIRVLLTGTGSVGSVEGYDVVVQHENDMIGVPFANEAVADGQTVPYEIETVAQLRSLANRVNGEKVNKDARPYSECYYVLKNDINLGTNQPWTPIGTEKHSFAGHFDGNGYQITGVINLGECENGGFFGRMHRGATVKNLTIAADTKIIRQGVNTSWVVGGFAGNVDSATFENCHHTGNITINTSYVGGFVGTSTGGTYRLCTNTGHLTNTGSGQVGGFVGVDNNSTFLGCYNTGDLSAGGRVGGILAQSWSQATITACWTGGNMTGNQIGGLFGQGNSMNITSSYCYSKYPICYSGGYNSQNVGVYYGKRPELAQILIMNEHLVSWGWMYKNDATLAPIEGNNIPSNPIKPW